jgi:hypothetical protein
VHRITSHFLLNYCSFVTYLYIHTYTNIIPHTILNSQTENHWLVTSELATCMYYFYYYFYFFYIETRGNRATIHATINGGASPAARSLSPARYQARPRNCSGRPPCTVRACATKAFFFFFFCCCCCLALDLIDVDAVEVGVREGDDGEGWVHLCELLEPLVAGAARLEGVHVAAHTHMHIQVHTHTYIHAGAHRYTHTGAHTYIHTGAHRYTHTGAHIRKRNITHHNTTRHDIYIIYM